MRNSSNSKKAQFLVLSAFAIVTMIFMISQWIEPYTIVDTSSIVMKEEFLIFNNLKEKAGETVIKSKDCEELNFNLEEYKNYVEKFALIKALNLDLNYRIIEPCSDSIRETNFNLTLSSYSLYIQSSFKANSTGLFED